MIQVEFDDLTYELLSNNQGEVLKVIHEGTDFYYKVHLKEEFNKLIVFSNGAFDRRKATPPVFMRSKWFDEFDANCVFIDDRTIHGNKLSLGWGVGTKEKHYLKNYIQFVKKVASILNIDTKDITYFGSSAGGFMSLAMASIHKGTTAIVNNPQTYINHYLPVYVNALFKTAFPGMTNQEIIKTYSNRISITNIFARNKNVPRVYYLQNRLCEGDMQKHLMPLLNNMDKYNLNSANINVILYNNKAAGHNPAEQKLTINYVNNIIKNKTYIH